MEPFTSSELVRLGNNWANTSSLSFPQSTVRSATRSSVRSMSAPRVLPFRRSDLISSRPKKRLLNKPTQEIMQPSLRRKLTKSIKGIGYLTPGDPFADRPRTLKHDFAFDLASEIGRRSVCATLWRHGYSNYDDTDTGVLSPALSAVNRTVDGVALSTAIRDGGSGPYDETAPPSILISSTSLWDLEAASWNARGCKMFYDTAASYSTVPDPLVPNYGAFYCYRDYIPETDHTKGTPFPAPQAVTALGNSALQKRPPFMVHLGSGSVSFSCQNKLPTNAEVEFIVYQIRDVQMSSDADPVDGFFEAHCLYSSSTSVCATQGPILTSNATGSGGNGIDDWDSVNDPDYKLLAIYPKFSEVQSPLIEKDRIKFVLSGGAYKTVSFDLPEQIYDSTKNSLVSGDPFVEDPTANSFYNLQTYVIVVAVNGVVMPVFTQPVANDSNSLTAPDHNNPSVVDRQHANSSVLFTGTYVEHPRPCLPTPQLGVYNNYPMLQDTVVEDADYNLCSGLVASMPVSVATGNTIAFSAIGSALQKQDVKEG